MGIYEPDADGVAKQVGFDRRLAHTDFESMLDAVNTEAVPLFTNCRYARYARNLCGQIGLAFHFSCCILAGIWARASRRGSRKLWRVLTRSMA